MSEPEEKLMSKKIELIPILRLADFKLEDGWEFTNGVIRHSDIEIIGHYGNVISLGLEIESDCWVGMFMPSYNFTRDIGFICRAVYDVIVGGCTDDTVSFASLAGKPCRVVSTRNRIIGIGNFMKDKWLLENNVKDWLKEQEDTDDKP